jgi:hypothetical protein
MILFLESPWSISCWFHLRWTWHHCFWWSSFSAASWASHLMTASTLIAPIIWSMVQSLVLLTQIYVAPWLWSQYILYYFYELSIFIIQNESWIEYSLSKSIVHFNQSIDRYILFDQSKGKYEHTFCLFRTKSKAKLIIAVVLPSLL